LRDTLLKIHRYVALGVSLILLVVGTTGCLLVFELRMDRWLDPDVSYAASQAPPIPIAQVLASVEGKFPGQKITEINPGAPGESTMVRTSGGLRVFVDGSGKILGTRTGEPLSFWVRHVHRELIGGKAGAFIVNIASALLVLQSLSGLYLWWPLKRVGVKWDASWTRVNFDLHHAVGFFSSALVCVIAVTGLIKAYGDQLQPFFDRVTNSPAMTRALSSKRPAGTTVSRITVDDAVASAKSQLPGAAIGRIAPPKGKDGSWVVTMKFPGDSTAPGRSWVVVDQYSGQPLATLDSRTAPLGSRIPIVNRAIHVGGLYGWPSRLLAFLTSLAVLIQTISGFWMWWRKRATQPVEARVVRPAEVNV